MRNQEDEAAAIVALIYETIFAPTPHRGLVPRNPPTAGPSAAFEDVTLDQLVPYLEAALASDGGGGPDSNAAMGGRIPSWEDLPLASCVVSRDLRLARATRKAIRLLAGDSILNVADGALSAGLPERQLELEQAIRQATDAGESRAISWIDGGGVEQIFLVAPISTCREELTAMLVLNVEVGAFDRLVASLSDSHGLTKSESEVTAHLAQGLSIDEIAERKQVSVNTVRTQVKTAFAKTGTTRQGELVALALGGPETWLRLVEGLRPDRQADSNGAPRASRTDGILELRDGRMLGYGDYGPESGQPVLLCHHLIGSRKERPLDEGLLDRLDIRLIVPERPGIGHSTPVQKPDLVGWAEGVQQLADALEIERFHVLGFSSGGPHAAACAALLAERVLALGLAASMMPIDEIPESLPLGLTQRLLTGMARRWPVGIRSVLTRRYARLHEDPRESLAQFVEKTNAADAEIFRNPALHDRRLDDLLDAGQVPATVFANELVMLSRPWGFDMLDLKLPVHFWHGRLDDFFACDQAEAISEMLPDSHTTFRDDWGHFFFYHDWELILGELVQTPSERSP